LKTVREAFGSSNELWQAQSPTQSGRPSDITMTPREHRKILARIDALMNTAEPSEAISMIRRNHGELSDLIRDEHGRLMPHLAGAALESVFSRCDRRRKLGAFFTPPWLVDHVITQSLGRSLDEGATPRLPRICDPSCGSGNFLLGVVRQLQEHGVSKDDAICECVYGVDINPHTVALCREVLASHADDTQRARIALEDNILIGDALRGSWPGQPDSEDGIDWNRAFPAPAADGGFDVVVGNPPYLNQLETRTAESRNAAAHLKSASDGLITRYADMSAAFYLLASMLVRPGGRFAMVLPQSFLSSNDIAALRQHLARSCSLEHVWLATEHVFSASVYTCVISARRQSSSVHIITRSSRTTLRSHEVERIDTPLLSAMPTWSPLASDLIGVPRVDVTGIPLSSFAEATADFRDEYYALQGSIVDEQHDDDRANPRLLTTGLITPGGNRWGSHTATIHGAKFMFPRARLSDLCKEDWITRWVNRRLKPKVLVASQTSVMECFDDHEGLYLPVTPLLSVIPNADTSTTMLAAALSSPVLSALALIRYGCGALHADSIKMSASQLLTLPMPGDRSAWERATTQFEGYASNVGNARVFGDAICHAYGLAQDDTTRLMEWWLSRLTSGRRKNRRNTTQ
jgi:hypothetical protein